MRTFTAAAAVCLLSCVCPGARAEAVKWRKDIHAAAKEASQSGKPMLVKVTADWCTYCHKMAKEFDDQRVARQVNRCFIPVSLDADANPQVVDAMGVEALPSTLVVSADLKILDRITGYKKASYIDDHLGKLCRRENLIKKPAVKTQPTSIATTAPKALVNSPGAPKIKPVPKMGMAFDGVCLVSLLDEKALVNGVDEHAAFYRGRRVRFASAAHKRKFEANPDRYWPVNDGNCPLHTGAPAMGDVDFAAIYKNRLWLFSNKAHRSQFAAAPERWQSKY